MKRTELYRQIQENGLYLEIEQMYGKNYTNCTNAELEEFLSKNNVKETKDCFTDCIALLNDAIDSAKKVCDKLDSATTLLSRAEKCN